MATETLPDTTDLDLLFRHLNQHYFQGTIEARVYWAKEWKGAWGKYYPKKKAIGINSLLKAAPHYVVAHTLYHEMLHQKHPSYRDPLRGHWVRHGPAFKKDERAFPYFESAKRWKRKQGQDLSRQAVKKTGVVLESLGVYQLGMSIRVTFNSEHFTIVELNPRAPRYPIIAKRQNGELYKLRRDQVILPGETEPRRDPNAVESWGGFRVGQQVRLRSRPGVFRIWGFNPRARKYKIVLEDASRARLRVSLRNCVVID